jgi:hypothetical protein
MHHLADFNIGRPDHDIRVAKIRILALAAFAIWDTGRAPG